MFERVLFPAPFSPSSACTSLSAASKSTASFATMPGKRFVIPRIATAGGWVCLGMRGEAGGARRSPRAIRLSLGATDDALHEPAHRVEVLDGQALALRDAQRPLLVVQRPGELVELAADERGLLLRDRLLRLRADLG